MAPATEKLFRLYSLLKTPDKSSSFKADLSGVFNMTTISSIWDTTKPLVFHFARHNISSEEKNQSNDKWRKEPIMANAA